jgi:hypothetical protein
MSATVMVHCTSCGAALAVSTELLGKKGRCRCGNVFVISDAVAREVPHVCEDSVMGWLEQDHESPPLPSAAVARRPEPPRAAPQHAPAPPTPKQGAQPIHKPAEAHAPAAEKHFPVCLASVDINGAVLTFNSELLYDQAFRLLFPQRCLVCGFDKHLYAHLVYWSRMQEAPPKGKPEPLPGTLELDYFNNLHSRELLAMLGRFKNMAEPYCLPFPYYVCSLCHSQGLITTDVTKHGEKHICSLTIAALPAAELFLAAACGAGDAGLARIRQVRKTDRMEPWRRLPHTVRVRLSQWFEPMENECLLAYMPDFDATRDNMGYSGIIVSNRRMLFSHGDRRLELPCNDPEVVHVSNMGDFAEVQLDAPAGPAATIKVHASCGARLEKLVARLGELATKRARHNGAAGSAAAPA